MLHNFIYAIFFQIGLFDRVHALIPEKYAIEQIVNNYTEENNHGYIEPIKSSLNYNDSHKIDKLYDYYYPNREIFKKYFIELSKLICELDDPNDWQKAGAIKASLYEKYKIKPQAVSEFTNLVNKVPEKFETERNEISTAQTENCGDKSFNSGIIFK